MAGLLGCDEGEPTNKSQPPMTSPSSIEVSDASLAKDRWLLKRYRGEIEIPSDLYSAYLDLTVAFKAGDRKAIERVCLPFAINISTALRPQNTVEWTGPRNDINLPFAKQHFTPEIDTARIEDADAILICTGSSALWFVRTTNGKWRLYSYLDKPVQ